MLPSLKMDQSPHSRKRKGAASASSDNTAPIEVSRNVTCNGGSTDCNSALVLFGSKHL